MYLNLAYSNFRDFKLYKNNLLASQVLQLASHSFIFSFSAGTSKLIYNKKTDPRKYSHTDANANERAIELNENISPATTYEFRVYLVAPTIEMKVPNQPAGTVEMESKAALENCFTNPSPLSGKQFEMLTSKFTKGH